MTHSYTGSPTERAGCTEALGPEPAWRVLLPRTYVWLMARGGYGGRGVPLHARTRGSEVPAPTPPTSASCPVKHCWVAVPVDGGAPRPGLLLEWRKDVGGR